jgi:phospholipid/cholesterol/gamma-HCH transport system substrate-binding protein
MSRRGPGSIAASPLLVGAVTVLVAIIAVFLAYNANSGLPFVPTYDLTVRLPDAANLVKGNDVNIGGARIGTVSEINPVPSDNGDATAEVKLKLDKDVQPLPTDTTVLVRPRSVLGLKYVELTPGTAKTGLKPGSVLPLRSARPQPVEINEVINTFNAPTRRGSQETLNGLGTGLAGRGTDINLAIPNLRRLLDSLEPVARVISAPRTRLSRLFPSLGATAAELAPVADTQAALFVNLDTTFAALASVARPFLQETISESPPTEQAGIVNFPRQRPFLRNSAALFRELRPGVDTLPKSAPALAAALQEGTETLPLTPPFNRRLEGVFRALGDLAESPLAEAGVRRLAQTARSLKPTLAFVTPVQTTCNYVTLWFRNVSSLLSYGDANGTWQRFVALVAADGPNNEGGPASAPANGPAPGNFLHNNPYPNTAAPGQPRECEAGNEPFTPGQQAIGNVPGNQGTTTQGQVARRSAAGGSR